MNRNIAVILSGRDAGLARTLGAAANEINLFQRRVEQMGTRSAKAAAALRTGLAAAAVALAIGLGAAIVSAAKFETQMANVETVAHAGARGIDLMSQAVLELGTEVPQTTTTLTKGLYNIASSGIYGANALQVLEVSAKAATAGLTDLDTSGKAVVAVLNAYGLAASDAADVSDILFKTVELGVFTYEELTSQIGDVIPAAATAKIEFGEVGSAMAAMSLAGLSAAESATSLNRLIQKIIKPSDALSAAFRKMGFESGAAALEQEGLFGTMELIRIATGGQITKLMELFPEIRAARGAYALLANEGMNYARTQEAIAVQQNRAGATQAAFNTQMEATGNQFKLLVNQIQVVGIRIGTAFLPAVRDAIAGIEQLGSRAGDAFRQLATMSAPLMEALGRAVENVGRALERLGAVVSPAARALGTLVAGATIAALTGLANALSLVAGFLADHPALIQAVAIAYGGAFVGRLLFAAAGFFRIQAGLLATKAAFAGMLAADVIPTLIARLGLLGSALNALRLGNLSLAVSNLGGAFAGLGKVLASPAFIGTAVVGSLIAFQQGFDNAKQSAKELIATIEEPFDLSTLQGGRDAVTALKDQLEVLDQEWEEMGGGGFGTILKGTIELLTPMKNKVIDNAVASRELADEIDKVQGKVMMWQHGIDTLSNTLGLSGAEIESWVDKLDIDLTDPLNVLGDVATQIRLAKFEAESASPATLAFNDALAAVADPAATATDRVAALDDAIQALIGTQLAASDAAIGFEQALDDMATQIAETGTNLDITTENGRKSAQSINDAAKAAIEHAQAVAEESGSIADGVAVLKEHRERLVDEATAALGSRDAAEQYINTLGLTPENIQTFIRLEGMESAMLEVDEFEEALRLVAEAEANPTVDIDTSKFDDNALKIAQVLVQIEQANPEAEVLLNGEKFTPTAEMVQAWAAQWEASSPMAQALLSIIDPEGKFETLQEAAQNWAATQTTATAGVDIAPALTGIAGAQEALFGWDSSEGTADVKADNTDAVNKMLDAASRLFGWDRSSGTGDVKADNSDAIRDINLGHSKLGFWDRSEGTANVNAKDNASGVIRNVQALLGGLHDKTFTVTAHFVQRGAPGPQIERLGGIEHARHGLMAGVVSKPSVLFGERETGGEAFIPRIGNPNRSKMVLAQAASWYGLQLMPRGQMVGATDNRDFRTIVNVAVNAQSIMDGKTLVGAIRDTTRAELAEHDKKLLRSLKSS